MKHASAAVLGTICLDEIRRPGIEKKFGLGGLFYSITTLCQLMRDEGTVYPVCKIGESDFERITREFRRYRSIDLQYVRKYPGRNNTVILDYYDGEKRTEYSRHLPAPFTLDELLPPPDAGIYLINFISGREMRYRTFRAFRRRLKIPVYIDLHSAFLEFRKNGERFYRFNRDWSRWHDSGDILQMNEIEAAILAGERQVFQNLRNNAGSTLAAGNSRRTGVKISAELRAFGRRLLSRGARAAIITRAREGLHVFWKSGNKSFDREIPAYTYGQALDTTGCGDVFGAAFVFRYLEGAEPPEAADFAGRAAGLCAALNSSGDLHRLHELLEKHGVL